MALADHEQGFLHSGPIPRNLPSILLNYLILKEEREKKKTLTNHPSKKDITKNGFPSSPGRCRTKPDLLALEKIKKT